MLVVSRSASIRAPELPRRCLPHERLIIHNGYPSEVRRARLRAPNGTFGTALRRCSTRPSCAWSRTAVRMTMVAMRSARIGVGIDPIDAELLQRHDVRDVAQQSAPVERLDADAHRQDAVGVQRSIRP